jgi:hypothetical protein
MIDPIIAPAQQATDALPMDVTLRESLAREFHVSARQVDVIYREELLRLVAGARINTFLGVLATRRVRVRLAHDCVNVVASRSAMNDEPLQASS